MMSFARFGAPLMTIGLMVAAPAVAQAPVAAAPAPVPVAPAVSPLSQIPGVVVQYYDVSGMTIAELQASIDAQRPRDAVTGQAVPSSAAWSIGVNMKKATTGAACKVIGATPTFKAQVVMPRLVTAEGVPAPVMAEWQRYVGSLEAKQAAALRSTYARLSEVEKAVLASTCEGAGAAANKAIEEISRPLVVAPVPATAPANPTG